MRHLILLLLPCLLLACDDTEPADTSDANNGTNNGAPCTIVGTAFIDGQQQDACRCDDGRIGVCQEDACVCVGAHRGDPAYGDGCGLVETERRLVDAGEGCDIPATPTEGAGWVCNPDEVRVDALLPYACRPACQTDSDCDRPEHGALLVCLDPYQSGQTHCHQIVCETDADCPAKAPLCRLSGDPDDVLDPQMFCITAAAGLQ